MVMPSRGAINYSFVDITLNAIFLVETFDRRARCAVLIHF